MDIENKYNSYLLWKLDKKEINKGEYYMLRISEHALNAFRIKYEDKDQFKDQVDKVILPYVRHLKLKEILNNKKPQ